MNLSRHFTLEELVFSDTAVREGIDNTPPADVVENLTFGANGVLEETRALLNRPMIPSSGFRCLTLNRLKKSKDDSQHVKGEALDFHVSGMTPEEIVRKLMASAVPYDQLIYEGTWVHISWRRVNPRRQVLRAIFKVHERTRYVPFE